MNLSISGCCLAKDLVEHMTEALLLLQYYEDFEED